MRPVLRETNECVVHREVPVRMVLAHDVADDAGAFARRPIRLQPHLLHRKKNSAVDGFQSVADVGERAADDHRHRVVEIRPAHLLFNVDGLNVQRTGAIAAGRRSQGKFWILIVSHGLGSRLSASHVSQKRRDVGHPRRRKSYVNTFICRCVMCRGSWCNYTMG